LPSNKDSECPREGNMSIYHEQELEIEYYKSYSNYTIVETRDNSDGTKYTH